MGHNNPIEGSHRHASPNALELWLDHTQDMTA